MPKTIGDISELIKAKLDKANCDISNELSIISNEEIKAGSIRKGYLVKNVFWDKWLQKLFAQFISLKVWALTITVVFAFMDILTGEQFMITFLAIMGVKGIKDVVLNRASSNKSNNNDIIDKV